MSAALAAIAGPEAITFGLRALQIVWINILLSGDNAVVIALACRGLDPGRRRLAIAGGAAFAVALRVALTFFVVTLLGLPYVKLVGGLLLLWIAVDLLRTRPDEEVAAAGSILAAIRTIAVADAVMSLDNVVAVAAAADGSLVLVVFGIVCSVPLIVFGSQLLLGVMRRFPVLVIAGAALLGYVAGGMIAQDPALDRLYRHLPVDPELPLEIGCVLVVLGAALALRLHRQGTTADRAECSGGGD